MKIENIQNLVNYWISLPYDTEEECPVCSVIYISTQQNVSSYKSQFEAKLSAGADELLICPRCGQLYRFTSWISSPDWGKSMAGITEPYEVSCLYKHSQSEIISWLERIIKHNPDSVKVISKKAPSNKKVKSEDKVFICPSCGSHDVDVKMRNEFTRFICLNCGNEDLVDDWQKDEWKSYGHL